MQHKYNNDDTFLARWLNGTLSEEEERDFKASSEYADFKRIAETSQELKVPKYDKVSALANIKKATQGAKVKTLANTQQSSRFRFLRLAAAAVFLLLAGFAFLFFNDSTAIGTGTGSQRIVDLPDGSKATLNANSSISYNKYGWNTNRSLHLNGEAFFEVKKGSDFVVETDKGTVSVLGTSFNVYARKATLEVHCFTGKVRVASTTTAKSIDITKGETANFRSGIGQKGNFNADHQQSWRAGESVYESAKLSRVLDDLEQQFGVSITPNSVNIQQAYTGTFLHKDLETALEMVLEPMGIGFEVKGKTVVLKN